MPCTHLRQLYELCQKHDLKIATSDLVKVVCQQCGEQEVCPSMLLDEYESLPTSSGDVADKKPTHPE